MALSPKSPGDELPAVDWNIVIALAQAAMRGTNNLSEITDPATARAALLLATLAATGDFDDLVNSPLVQRSDGDGHYVVDQYGEIAEKITTAGVRHIANAIISVLQMGGNVSVSETSIAVDALSWVDEYGNVSAAIATDGAWKLPGVKFSVAPAGYALVIADEFGNIGGSITEDGVGAGILGGGAGGSGGSSGTTYSAEEQQRRSARAVALSAAVASETNTTAARPVWKYSHVLTWSQSLGSGWEGWPSLSKTQPYDNLMVGDSVRPGSESNSFWVQLGTAAFNPLVATVMTNSTSGTLVSDGTVAGYSPGNTALGETPLEGALNFWRKQQLQFRGLASDPTRLLVGSSCGVGGKTIAELSSGASPNLFNRLVDCAEVAEGLASGLSATYGIAAVLFLQGEADAVNGSMTIATYKAALATLQADITSQVAVAVAGQAQPPAIFSYQTSGSYVRDTNNLAVSQAQLEAAQEFDNWYMAAPSYPVTDKAGHLDPNGYRWLGQQFGKVLHQVLDLGRGWMPVHPIRATYRGTQVLIDFHVPHPPLQFQPCYVALAATTYAAKGFSVKDDAGTVALTAEIVGDACVLLTLGRELSTNPYVWYGDYTTHAGNGNLCDSDPTIAADNYEYTGGTGQYAGADIAALKDQPYPLWNWCVLFRMAITSDPAS